MNYRTCLLHLSTAFRRNKQGAVLSVLNLIIAISVFFTVFIYVIWDFSHNRVWADSDNIYRVTSSDIPTFGQAFKIAAFPDAGLPQLLDYIGDQAIDVTTMGAIKATANINQDTINIPLYLVNPNFFDFFQVETVEGNLEYAITTPGYIAIEEKKAAEIFRTDLSAIINKTIILKGSDSSSGSGGEREFTVGAIYKLPSPITDATRFSVLTLMHDFSRSLSPSFSPTSPNNYVNIWIKAESREVAGKIESALDGFTLLQGAMGGQGKLSLEALHDIYYSDDNSFSDLPSGNLPKTMAIAFIGLMVLVAGCSNAISTSLAESLGQIKSTGVRKAFGATRTHIFVLNLATQMGLILTALLPAVAITQVLIDPVATQLTETAFGIVEEISINPFSYLMELLTIAFLLSLINSFFPGIYLTRFKPALLLGNTLLFTKLKGLGVRVFLVTVQFAAAIFLITLALSFTAQLQLSTNRNLGFNADDLVWASTGPSQDVNTDPLLEAIRQIPSVQKVGMIASAPSTVSTSYFFEPPKLVRTTNDEAGFQVSFRSVGFNFFDTAGIPLIAGREFSSERDFSAGGQALQNEGPVNIVLNESAMHSLGFSNSQAAIGQIVYEQQSFNETTNHAPRLIIGVVKDSSYFQLKEQTGKAEVYRLNSGANAAGSILIRHDGSNEVSLRQEIEAAWMRVTGSEPFYYVYVDDLVKNTYASETRTTSLLVIAAIATILLACIGMYGLVSSTLNSQSRFIAIRSVFGADVVHIMALYCIRFSKPILVAILLSGPVAIFIVFRWMEQFPYQLAKAWIALIGFGAAAFILLLAWGVVCILTAMVLRRKPGRVLQYE